MTHGSAELIDAINVDRTPSRYRKFVRRRLGVVYEADRARAIEEAAIRTEAEVKVKDNPVDLINVALEELIRARCEVPGYSTLDELAARIRAEVNSAIFHGIGRRKAGGLALERSHPRSARAALSAAIRHDPVLAAGRSGGSPPPMRAYRAVVALRPPAGPRWPGERGHRAAQFE